MLQFFKCVAWEEPIWVTLIGADSYHMIINISLQVSHRCTSIWSIVNSKDTKNDSSTILQLYRNNFVFVFHLSLLQFLFRHDIWQRDGSIESH